MLVLILTNEHEYRHLSSSSLYTAHLLIVELGADLTAWDHGDLPLGATLSHNLPRFRRVRGMDPA